MQEKISLLEHQLNSQKSSGDASDESSSLDRRILDHVRDHSAAAALSALARVPTPTIPFGDSMTPNASYCSPDREAASLTILNQRRTDGNETYEWDEGGDEEELGTDAMGSASKGDYHPGFFGTHP